MSSGGKGFFKSLPKLAFGSASLLAALYVALSPRLLPALYLKRLFRPLKYPQGDWQIEQLEGIAREDIHFFATDGSRLHGWFFKGKSDQVILFSHGNSGNLTGRLKMAGLLLRTGASLMLYDYRGYGRSEGNPTVAGVIEDSIAAFDFLIRERGYHPDKIVLYGESLGTAITSEIAAQRPCAGMILQSGFTTLPDIGAQHVPITRIYPRFMYPRPLLDNMTRLAANKRPLLIIHGTKDAVVPFRHAKELFERAAEPKMLLELPDCAHSDIWSVAPDTYVNAVKTFLSSVEKR